MLERIMNTRSPISGIRVEAPMFLVIDLWHWHRGLALLVLTFGAASGAAFSPV